MCIINHTYKFIFVHIPKCGGTSIAEYFAQYSRYRDLELGGTALGETMQDEFRKRYGLRKHSSASDIRRVMGVSEFGAYESFAAVRDPLSRLRSSYFYLKHNFKTYITKKEAVSDTDMAGWKTVARFGSFEDFFKSSYWEDNDSVDGLLAPQTSWLTDEAGTIIVKHVAKLKDIEAAVQKFGEAVGLPVDGEKFPNQTVQVLNRSYAVENRSAYLLAKAIWKLTGKTLVRERQPFRASDKDKQRLYARYKADYENFGFDI